MIFRARKVDTVESRFAFFRRRLHNGDVVWLGTYFVACVVCPFGPYEKYFEHHQEAIDYLRSRRKRKIKAPSPSGGRK